ncbi:hypothetical protein ACVWW4_000228 [Bradyrhizobium sp. LB7.1]
MPPEHPGFWKSPKNYPKAHPLLPRPRCTVASVLLSIMPLGVLPTVEDRPID